MNPDRTEVLFKVAYRALAYRHSKRWEASTCIDFYTFKSLVMRECVYCGFVGSNKVRDVQRGKKLSDTVLRINGIDRRDNERGYVEGNCVPCCKFCNNSKAIMSVDYFKAWVKRVYEHLELGGK